MMVCPRPPVYALPCLGCSGWQAGLASFVEKRVKPPPMPRGQPGFGEWAMQSIGLSTSVLSTGTRDTCCSCKPGGCNTPCTLLPGFQMWCQADLSSCGRHLRASYSFHSAEFVEYSQKRFHTRWIAWPQDVASQVELTPGSFPRKVPHEDPSTFS